MSQKLIASPSGQAPVEKGFENVSESWVLYDTVLIGGFTPQMNFNEGYFATFTLLGAATSVPFFNIRNRNHGLAYNNLDKRDQLPFVMKIYSVGVSFFGPSTVTYRDNAGAPLGPQRTALDLFESELPKHTSLTLTTNQDDRLKIGSLLAPPGYGMMVSGVAQGDTESAVVPYPAISKVSWCQGIPTLTNKWGFRKPLEIPRTANMSVRLDFSEYAREMLTAMPGPYYQPFRSAADTSVFAFKWGMCGIQVTIGGIREVQQRGQYHA